MFQNGQYHMSHMLRSAKFRIGRNMYPIVITDDSPGKTCNLRFLYSAGFCVNQIGLHLRNQLAASFLFQHIDSRLKQVKTLMLRLLIYRNINRSVSTTHIKRLFKWIALLFFSPPSGLKKHSCPAQDWRPVPTQTYSRFRAVFVRSIPMKIHRIHFHHKQYQCCPNFFCTANGRL